MADIAIRASGLGKRYRLGATHGGQYRTLREAIANAFRKRPESSQPPRDEMLWALEDVSFEVSRGEVLGIIGGNGAGKTTLLKILSRITAPTTGQVELEGRVASLLEVGTGFHPELTGRENILLNGAILGMKKTEIIRKFDEIVCFSGVERFLDTPVKRYSSGMYVRLAFAVAAHLEPEILLVDEVLAVGDVEFQRKCLGKMDEVAHGGRTILFVSHNMSSMLRLCSRGILLDQGRIAVDGPIGPCIEAYMARHRVCPDLSELDNVSREGSGAIRVSALRVVGDEGVALRPRTGARFELQLKFAGEATAPDLNVGVGVDDLRGERVLTLFTRFDPQFTGTRPEGPSATIACRTRSLPLRPGTYRLTTHVAQRGEVCDHVREAAEVVIEDDDFYGTGFVPTTTQGPLMLEQEWYWLEADADNVGPELR